MKTRFLALWTVAVVAVATAFVVHLAIRFENVRLGYEVGAARKQQRTLLEQQRKLGVEAATLRGSDRVETIAQRLLGMRLPTSDQIVTLDDAAPRRALSGATQ
ncbi:MAG: cell division protein FtsL [Myxococcales bacterium]|nr:cell division protein FtsL [Myxococcales bacterium]